MKTFLFSIFLAVVTLPFIGKAAETMFFSTQGKYTLFLEYTLVISPDESSRLPMATINYTSDGGNGVGLGTTQPTDPFLAYWDAATQTLWWGTARSVGYLDVHVLRSSRSGTYPRGVPIQNYNHAPAIPAVFTAELDRAIPNHP